MEDVQTINSLKLQYYTVEQVMSIILDKFESKISKSKEQIYYFFSSKGIKDIHYTQESENKALRILPEGVLFYLTILVAEYNQIINKNKEV